MTRYNGSDYREIQIAYREGVDRVLQYVESIHAYPELMAELRWAIEEGII